MYWTSCWMPPLQATLQGYTPRILLLVHILPWLETNRVELSVCMPSGKPILLATLMCCMYRTEPATTLSEFNLMVRMHGKPLGVTTRVLIIEAIGYGNALRWLLYTVVYVTIPLKRVSYYMDRLKTEPLGSQRLRAHVPAARRNSLSIKELSVSLTLRGETYACLWS